MNNLSVLFDLSKVNFFRKPFPHIVIMDALPRQIADQLTSEFPIQAFDMSTSNKRFDVSAKEVNSSRDFSPLWKSFIKYHSSGEFYRELIEIFKPHLPDKDYDFYSNLSTGIRGTHQHSKDQILLDAQISINTPVTSESSVRKAHVDNTNKLFSGLFYLRSKDDLSKGGDLEILEWNKSYTSKHKLKFYQEGVNAKHYSTFKRIKYDNNIAVLFLNSIDALHKVTERQLTTFPRCFVNLVGELEKDIFFKETFLKRKTTSLKANGKNFIKKLLNKQ
jgi:hypothetical protein